MHMLIHEKSGPYPPRVPSHSWYLFADGIYGYVGLCNHSGQYTAGLTLLLNNCRFCQLLQSSRLTG